MSTFFNGEFGYELTLVIPYAYYLYLNHKLKKTKSSKLTKCFYYFSDNHEEKYTKRWATKNTGLCLESPNKNITCKDLNYEQWIPPPYKSFYKNDILKFDKEVLIIHNKFNKEWGSDPINYIDKITLQTLFEKFKDKYQIIYINPLLINIIADTAEALSLGDDLLLEQYPEVLNFNSLYEQYKQNYNFNELQLLTHANCDKFISVQGGASVLASYFGGINIIFSIKGTEFNKDSYNGYFKKFSNSNIVHVTNYDNLIDNAIKYLN